jgi:hypothetical protein
MKASSAIWTVIVIPLILASSFIYLHGFRGLLPYYIDPDEPHFYLAASEIRLTGRVQINPLYPPLRPYQMVATQWVVDVLSGGRATSTVYAIFARAESAFFAVLLLAVLHRIGCNLHSRLAGLFAVSLIMADSQLVSFSHVARGDSLSWLLSAGAILGTLRLLRQETKGQWAIVVLCSLGAFLAKYSAAPIWLLPGYLVLRKLFPKQIVQWFIVGAGAIASLGFIAYTRANPDVWEFAFSKTGFGFLLSRDFNLLRNLQTSTSVVIAGLGTGWTVIGLGLLPALLMWGRLRFTTAQLTVMALLAAVVVGTAAVFTLTTARYHDVYNVVLIWAIFGGIALTWLAEKGRIPGLLISFGLIVVLGWPRFASAWDYGQAYATPHTHATLGNWFIENVPQGTRAVIEQSTPFNSYAGFPGRQQIYHQYGVESMFNETAEAYRQRGYEYLVWSSKGLHEPPYTDFETVDQQPYFDNAEVALRLDNSKSRGPQLLIFRLKPIQQHVLYAWFTPAISFRGYDLDKETFKPGDEVRLMLYWMSAEKIKVNYVVFVHVLDPQTGRLIVGQDGPPDYGNTPTWKWKGDMQFIRDQRIFTIPADALPGIYTLRIGMYDADTKARVQVLDLRSQPVGDGLVLQEIEIKQP